jgi:GNAT superfamily N-acetyltransferase
MSESIKIHEVFPNYVPKVSPKEWRPDAYKIAFQALNVAGCRRLVAIDGKEDVGFAAFRKTDDNYQLVSLASKYPGRGIGRRLVHAIETIGPIWVVSDPLADKFYERIGLIEVDRDSMGRKIYERRK